MCDYIEDTLGLDYFNSTKFRKATVDVQEAMRSHPLAPATMVGNTISILSQGATSFALGGALFKSVGLAGNAYALTAAKGVVADIIGFDPHGPGLANLIGEHAPVLKDSLAYIAHNPDDTKFQGYMKNALEGFIISSMLDLFIKGATGAYRKMSKKEATKAVQADLKSVEKELLALPAPKQGPTTLTNPDVAMPMGGKVDTAPFNQVVDSMREQGLDAAYKTMRSELGESLDAWVKMADLPTGTSEGMLKTAIIDGQHAAESIYKHSFNLLLKDGATDGKSIEEAINAAISRANDVYDQRILLSLADQLGVKPEALDEVLKLSPKDFEAIRLKGMEAGGVTAEQIIRNEYGISLKEFTDILQTPAPEHLRWLEDTRAAKTASDQAQAQSEYLRTGKPLAEPPASPPMVEAPSRPPLSKEEALRQASEAWNTSMESTQSARDAEELAAVTAEAYKDKESIMRALKDFSEQGKAPSDVPPTRTPFDDPYATTPSPAQADVIRRREERLKKPRKPLDEATPSTAPSGGSTTPSEAPTGINTPPRPPEAPTGHSDGTTEGTNRVGLPADTPVQRFYDEYRANLEKAGTPQSYIPKHDIANVDSVLKDATRADESLEALIRTGNNIEDNLLNRPPSEYTRTPNSEMVEEAAQSLLDNIRTLSDHGLSKKAKLDDLHLQGLVGLFEQIPKLSIVVTKAKACLQASGMRVSAFVKSLDEMTEAGLKAGNQAFDELLARIDPLIREYSTVQTYYDSISSNIGAGLQAFKANHSHLTDLLMDSEYLKFGTDVDSMLKSMKIDDKIALLRKAAAESNAIKKHKLMTTVKTNKGMKAYGMVHELFVNNILGGFRTLSVNGLGSAGKLFALEPLNNMLAGWGVHKGGFFTINDRELWDRGVHTFYDIGETIKDSWAIAREAWRLGESITVPDSTLFREANGGAKYRISGQYLGLDPDKALYGFVDTIGKAANIPTRFMLTTDDMFKQIAARQHVKTMLYTEAVKRFETLADTLPKGTTKKQFIADYIAENFPKYIGDATTAGGHKVKNGRILSEEAIQAAKETTYTTDLRADSLGGRVQALARIPGINLFVPFVKTPVNIFADAIAHTPAAVLTRDFREAIGSGNYQRAAKAWSKMGLGTTASFAVLYGVINGDITGKGPKNTSTRDALMQTGWRPYSIKIGDTYYDYSRLEPIGTLMSLLANTSEAIQVLHMNQDEYGTDKTTADKIIELGGVMMATAANILTTKTYLDGFSDLIKIAGGSDDGSRILQNLAVSMTVPNWAKSLSIMKNPVIRETAGYVDEVRSRIPFLAEDLPPKRSWLDGREIMMTGGIAAGFSPIVAESMTGKSSLVADELNKLGGGITKPEYRIGKVELNTAQKSEYARLHGTIKLNGKTLMEALEQTINSSAYDKERKINTTDTKNPYDNPRVALLRDVVTKYRNAAKKELMRTDKELAEAVQLNKLPEPTRRLIEQRKQKPNTGNALTGIIDWNKTAW